MLRLASIIYVMASSVLMGIGVTAVLATPALDSTSDKWIIVAAVVGAIIALPVSYVVAKAIDKEIRRL